MSYCRVELCGCKLFTTIRISLLWDFTFLAGYSLTRRSIRSRWRQFFTKESTISAAERRCLWSELTQFHSNPSFGIHCRGFEHHSNVWGGPWWRRCWRWWGSNSRGSEISWGEWKGSVASKISRSELIKATDHTFPIMIKLYMDICGSQGRSIYRSNVNRFLWYLAFGITNLKFFKQHFLKKIAAGHPKPHEIIALKDS